MEYAAPLQPPGSTARTTIRRIADRAVRERAALHAVLDAGLVAHVSVVDDGQPFVLPVAYARDGERVIFHGSTGSRLFRQLADGQPTCLTVTLLDGLVVARSAFESSMNYRSAMVLGACAVLDGDDKDAALRIITEHLLPGRWGDVRQPSRKESAATLVLALPLDEASVKIREGGPEDLAEDVGLPYWAGEVPLRESFGTPIPAEDLDPSMALPDYIARWTR